MVDVKKNVEKLIFEIEKGKIPPEKAWDKIKKLKELYVKNYSEQSWHSYIGNKFQNIVYSILKGLSLIHI